jgi:acyl-CoA synthetase (NDP forming)
VKSEKRQSLSAPEAKIVADAYGIPVPQEGLGETADAAAALADTMGYPVVLKIVSPDILHKTEAGGVIVGFRTLRAYVPASSRSSKARGPIRATRRSAASRCSRCCRPALKR